MSKKLMVFNCSCNVIGGGVQNAVNFIKQIYGHNEELDWYFILSEAVYHQVKELVSVDRYSVISSPAKSLLSRYRVKKLVGKINASVVYTSAGPSYVRFSCVHVLGCSNPYVLGANYYAFNLLGGLFHKAIRFLHTKYQRFYLRKADYYICQTQSSKISMSNLGIERGNISVVNNSISTPFLDFFMSEDITEPININEEIKVLIPTAYYKHKDLERIVGLLDDINRKSNKKIIFCLTLDNSNFNFLTNYVSDQKLLHNLGPYKHSDALGLYLSHDFILQPSALEVFSTSYIEALAAKKILVVPDFNFTRDICQTSAVYYDVQSNDDFIKKIINVSENLHNTLINFEERKRLLSIYGSQKDRFSKITRILHKAIQ